MTDERADRIARESAPPAQGLLPTERWVVSLLSLLQGVLAGWAAWALPWTSLNTFGIACGLLGAGHLGTSLLVLARSPLALSSWKLTSLVGLGVLVLVSWQVFTGGAYLAALYGALGEGLFAALVAIWGLFVLLILPTACWSLVRGRNARPQLGRMPWIGAGLCVTGLLLACLVVHQRNRIPDSSFADAEAALAELRWLLTDLAEQAAAPTPRRADKLGPVKCEQPPGEGNVTLIAAYSARDSSPTRKTSYRSRCVQADTLEAAARVLEPVLRREATGPRIQLDSITSVSDAQAGPTWTSAFALRPALDGLCVGTRCWMPWQLLARDAYVKHRPLDFIGDLKFGADVSKLSAKLRELDPESGDAPARRITTQSWVLSESGMTEVSRLRPVLVDDSPAALSGAALALEAHIRDSQLRDGKFRYLLHPFTGKAETKSFNLARQAGTLLVLCELGEQSEAVHTTIERGLSLLERHAVSDTSDLVGGLSKERGATQVELGDSALPLVALVECRGRVGSRFDALIGKLSRLVLALQREDGGFHPAYDLAEGRVRLGPEPLYAPGQALLALALLETSSTSAPPPAGFPAADQLRNARLSGMRYVASKHWPSSLYPYFFIEENWHCLTARAALKLERVDAYERFCLDYIRFKSRLILDEDSDVDPMFVGGFGFGNVIPPHNTGAAGFAEAVAAAIAVKHARGEPRDDDQARLRDVLRFLLRQQWTAHNCFGCDPRALGSISEHTHSPISRIDFAQHTWAAIGHGTRALEL